MPRCAWAGTDPLYIDYHDHEWGFPIRDDRVLFEKICLEGFQSGLSWITILRKRENFRRAFRDFDIDRAARFGARDVERLLKDAGIVRHRGKIESVINNARRAREIIREYGSLASYLWKWTSADALSKDLKRRGWTFVGPTTIYAFMQACGLVNDHALDCPTRLEVFLSNVAPKLHEGSYVFRSGEIEGAIATFREEEGVTSVVPGGDDPFAWITLNANTDLHLVGFLAAITSRLAAAGISTNVFSALHHDHLFVPYNRRHEAMRLFARNPAAHR
jgi:DNA-3-methyladenine glycosylase I